MSSPPNPDAVIAALAIRGLLDLADSILRAPRCYSPGALRTQQDASRGCRPPRALVACPIPSRSTL